MKKRVVQVSIDILVNEDDGSNFEQSVLSILKKNSYEVIGSDSRDMTSQYRYFIDEVSEFVQESGFAEASKAIDCEYDL